LYATTATGWVAFGFSEDLDTAAHEAARAMSRLMNRLFGFTHCEALNLMGVAADMRITQIVNGIKGVHVILPYDAIG
jgi:acetamidase/formamidase